LLVYPEFPPSYWGFRYALELLGKRSSMPPMGLVIAIRLAIKGWHLQRFTAQMLAADAFRATALEGYERAEGLLERAATASERLRRTIELGIILTGNADRAEVASDAALTLI